MQLTALWVVIDSLIKCVSFSSLKPGLNNEEYQVVIGNDTTRYIIDDLESARNYTFYIVAYMPMGASRMSDHVFQHTLEDGEALSLAPTYTNIQSTLAFIEL